MHALTQTRSTTPAPATLTVSQARAALAIAERNYRHSRLPSTRGETARRLANARAQLADAVAATLAGGAR